MDTNLISRAATTRVSLRGSKDPGLYRVLVEGRIAGSVRHTPEGWLPIGGFVFNAGLQSAYFSTAPAAALALADRLRGRASS